MQTNLLSLVQTAHRPGGGLVQHFSRWKRPPARHVELQNPSNSGPVWTRQRAARPRVRQVPVSEKNRKETARKKRRKRNYEWKEIAIKQKHCGWPVREPCISDWATEGGAPLHSEIIVVFWLRDRVSISPSPSRRAPDCSPGASANFLGAESATSWRF